VISFDEMRSDPDTAEPPARSGTGGCSRAFEEKLVD
jgi:hypothetical protein